MPTRKRPIAVTGISVLMIAAGTLTLARLFIEGRNHAAFLANAGIWILLVGLAGIACGVFMLRGHNWARWLTLVWIAFHIFVSFFHSGREIWVHVVLLLLIAYALFRREERAYFQHED